MKRVLINPLIRSGMRKHRNMGTDDYSAMLDRLAGKLAYLSEGQLAGLRALCTNMAQGKGGDVWPPEVAITKWAYRIQAPPPLLTEYVPSLLRSEMGRRARAFGYHVELFQAATRLGPPPGKYDLSRLAAQADANRRKLAIVTGQIERGVRPLEDDRRWLDWYLQQEAECLAIMQAQDADAGEAA